MRVKRADKKILEQATSVLLREDPMSIGEYFNSVINRIKNEIDQHSEEYLLNVNAGELVEYYTKKYCLPLIEKDESRKINVQKLKSGRRYVPLQVFYPIVPKENLQTVVKKRSSTNFVGGFPLGLQGDWLVSHTEMRNEKSLEAHIENLNKVIGWKNNDVRAGNQNIRNRIKTHIENKQGMLRRDYDQLEAILQKVQIPLVIRKEKTLPIVDLGVKEELKPLIKPEPKRRKELVLDRTILKTLIDYIRRSCLSFETTPKAFSKLQEEDLRDIILGNLNAIFRGEATGETFSKLGKTDIYLRISEGNILIIECKNWHGEKKYGDGIDQLFDYLTWRQNYGILIAFVRRKNFTKIIQKAKETTQEHETFLRILSRESASEFVTEHRFPDDVEKKVEIHHLLFNLFVS